MLCQNILTFLDPLFFIFLQLLFEHLKDMKWTDSVTINVMEACVVQISNRDIFFIIHSQFSQI